MSALLHIAAARKSANKQRILCHNGAKIGSFVRVNRTRHAGGGPSMQMQIMPEQTG